jgi:hypothetical protein
VHFLDNPELDFDNLQASGDLLVGLRWVSRDHYLFEVLDGMGTVKYLAKIERLEETEKGTRMRINFLNPLGEGFLGQTESIWVFSPPNITSSDYDQISIPTLDGGEFKITGLSLKSVEFQAGQGQVPTQLDQVQVQYGENNTVTIVYTDAQGNVHRFDAVNLNKSGTVWSHGLKMIEVTPEGAVLFTESTTTFDTAPSGGLLVYNWYHSFLFNRTGQVLERNQHSGVINDSYAALHFLNNPAQDIEDLQPSNYGMQVGLKQVSANEYVFIALDSTTAGVRYLAKIERLEVTKKGTQMRITFLDPVTGAVLGQTEGTWVFTGGKDQEQINIPTLDGGYFHFVGLKLRFLTDTGFEALGHRSADQGMALTKLGQVKVTYGENDRATVVYTDPGGYVHRFAAVNLNQPGTVWNDGVMSIWVTNFGQVAFSESWEYPSNEKPESWTHYYVFYRTGDVVLEEYSYQGYLPTTKFPQYLYDVHFLNHPELDIINLKESGGMLVGMKQVSENEYIFVALGGGGVKYLAKIEKLSPTGQQARMRITFLDPVTGAVLGQTEGTWDVNVSKVKNVVQITIPTLDGGEFKIKAAIIGFSLINVAFQPAVQPISAKDAVKMAARAGLGRVEGINGVLGCVLAAGLFLAVAAFVVWGKVGARLYVPRLGSMEALAGYEPMPKPKAWSISYARGGRVYLDKEAMLRIPPLMRWLFLVHERVHAAEQLAQGAGAEAAAGTATAALTQRAAEERAYLAMYRAARHLSAVQGMQAEGLRTPARPAVAVPALQRRGILAAPGLRGLQQLSPAFGRPLGSGAMGVRSWVNQLNMVGLTALLFPLVSSWQVTVGSVQMNPSAWLTVLFAFGGLLLVRMALYALAQGTQPYRLTATGQRRLADSLGLDLAQVRIAPLSEAYPSQNVLAKFALGVPYGYYAENPGQGPATIYLADGMLRTILESHGETPAERLRLALMGLLFRNTVQDALSEWMRPEAAGAGVTARMGRAVESQALRQKTGTFAGMIGVGSALAGGLLAAMASLPVLIPALVVGLVGGGLAWMYGQAVNARYNYGPARDAAEYTSADYAASRTNVGKYATRRGETLAIDPADLMGVALGLIQEAHGQRVQGVEEAKAWMSAHDAEGFGREIDTLVRIGREQGSAWAPVIESALGEWQGKGGTASAQVRNAVAAVLLEQGARAENVVRGEYTPSGRMYVLNSPEQFAQVVKSLEEAQAAAQARGQAALATKIDGFLTGMRKLAEASRQVSAGEMLEVSTDVQGVLMPWLAGYAAQTGVEAAWNLGQDQADLLHMGAVNTGRHQLEPMKLNDGTLVMVPRTVVCEVSGARAYMAGNWRSLLESGEVTARDYYRARVESSSSARQHNSLGTPLRVLGRLLPGDNFVTGTLKQGALVLDREGYLLGQAVSLGLIQQGANGAYAAARGTVLGAQLANANSGLRAVMADGDLGNVLEFQRQEARALIRVLRTHPGDGVLVEESVGYLNELAPLGHEVVGQQRGRALVLPNLLWGAYMKGGFGFLRRTMGQYPEVFMLDDEKLDKVIPRREMYSAAQAA